MFKLRYQCEIAEASKGRNGKLRYWCRTHGETATGPDGALAECDKANDDVPEAVEISADDYPGGIAIWGAVPPVYDTTQLKLDYGIHVHARKEPSGKKNIDQTFSSILVRYRQDLLYASRRIDNDAAVNFYLSQFVEAPIKYLFCSHCSALHLDAGEFAVKPHRKHLCHACGRYFNDSEQAVSNPIAYLRERWNVKEMQIKASSKNIDIDQKAHPGGVRIWASNPAILWTAQKPEEAGIHVHLYPTQGWDTSIDDTFGSVNIDGQNIDKEAVSYLMAQRSLPHLRDRVVSLYCPKCGVAAFDKGSEAFITRNNRTCVGCGENYRVKGSVKKVVSNPLVDILRALSKNSPSLINNSKIEGWK